jgi:hypothetical protein
LRHSGHFSPPKKIAENTGHPSRTSVTAQEACASSELLDQFVTCEPVANLKRGGVFGVGAVDGIL